MSYKYTGTVTLETITCYLCAMVFAVPAEWKQFRRNDHASFYCPNGHGQSYLARSEAERLKIDLEREQRQTATFRERAIGAERAKDKAEKSIDRLKKRAAAGVCPCCNRTFAQLTEHMKSKHPQFRQLQGLDAKKQLAEKVQ